jgi:hypothetical protein
MVNVQRQTWNAPRLAPTNRACCRPAPTTSLRSRNVISRLKLKRSATAVRMSATEADGSVPT